jgi:hypothetical protein
VTISNTVLIKGTRIYALKASGSEIKHGTAGIDDAAVLNAALHRTGITLVKAGAYKIRQDLTPIQYSGLQGEGKEKTILSLASGKSILAFNPNITFDGFTITGTPFMGVFITASNIIVRNINCRDSQHSDSAFLVYADPNDLKNILFENCETTKWHSFGFKVDSTRPTAQVDNLQFKNCKAIDCGRYSSLNPWITGFDVAEQCNVSNCTFTDCLATGSAETGFHSELSNKYSNIKYINCVANNNGQKVNPLFGYGFLITDGISITHCSGMANKNGDLYIENPKANPIQRIITCNGLLPDIVNGL